jgi:hypothetical protein
MYKKSGYGCVVRFGIYVPPANAGLRVSIAVNGITGRRNSSLPIPYSELVILER